MVVINNFIVLALLLTNKGKEYVYSHPPLSKRGILKALGQDPSKSDVLTVSTNSDGEVKLVGGGGAIVTLDRLGASFVDNVGAANPTGSDLRGIAAASHQPTSNPRYVWIIILLYLGPRTKVQKSPIT